MKKLISYVFPIYNEQDNIPLLYKTMDGVLNENNKYNYELIFINDGSKDKSLELLIQLQQKDKRVTVIDLARNFGHQLAVTAGLDYAHGDAVIVMDSDLQDPPKISLKLIDKWEEGYDVVYAQRITRKDPVFKKIAIDIFYRVLQKLADIDIPRNTGDFRLLDRKIVDEIKKFTEHNRFLRGMVSFVGHKQIAVQYDRDGRHAGKSNYPFRKLLKLASDGILSFSSAPLKLISGLGYIFAGLSSIGIIYALIIRFFFPAISIEGWTFIVISILLIGGVQMIMLGVLGSYIGRIYTESQGRPLYIIQRTYKSDK